MSTSELMATTSLTTAEASRLAECEEIIDRGQGTFLQVADALIKIRDGRLYRRDHATFDDYCWGRWQFSRQRAYQLIDAAAVAKECQPGVDIQDERAARALGTIPEESRPEVERLASHKTGGKPLTSRAVGEAKAELGIARPKKDVAKKGRDRRLRTRRRSRTRSGAEGLIASAEKLVKVVGGCVILAEFVRKILDYARRANCLDSDDVLVAVLEILSGQKNRKNAADRAAEAEQAVA